MNRLYVLQEALNPTHLRQDEIRSNSNIDRSLFLISSQDPYVNAGLGQLCDALRHTRLQTILDRRGADNFNPYKFICLKDVIFHARTLYKGN